MFFIAILAETNRPPFDLPEAESELVAGFMTEHGASIFVFFFLGEYSSLILMSAFMSIFFLGGHHCPDLHKLILDPIFFFFNYFFSMNYSLNIYNSSNIFNSFLIYSDSDVLEKIKTIYLNIFYLNNDSSTIFSSKDIIFESVNILIDKIYGSFILGFKIVIVAFFYI